VNDPVKDPLAIGLGALATGAGVVAVLRERVDPVYWRFVGEDPLWMGLFAGVALGAFFGWVRSKSIDNIWQRGVIGVLAAVGAVLIGFLAAPLFGFFGLAGLFAWFILSAAFGSLGSRWATRGSGV